MSVLERYLGELPTIRAQVAEESLTNVTDADKTAFGLGRAVGRLEGLRLAEETLQRLLNEPETNESEPRRHRGKA